ncbi:hypothetical protein Pcinc_033471 [Petrolisthes cinctipes]|uniref:Uncharacterized protein n=1 Tax=Petrolisthes cinctipes TaxID=88211 RepID=A0AAE1ESB2_PETCI|nr:hypothetical protein Pcinc_033471 [Petrolisthes cinctipes]
MNRVRGAGVRVLLGWVQSSPISTISLHQQIITRSLTAISHASISKHHRCEKRFTHVSDTANRTQLATRHFSQDAGKELSAAEIKRAIDNISEKFTEAMELMNDARSSAGTTYFSEDMEDTQAQVKDTLEDYTSLLGQLNKQQKKNVIQSVGLKMEELKAQISLLEELAKE